MIEAVIAGIVALLVAMVTSVATSRREQRKIHFELRTEFMAEAALTELLRHPRWELRSFEAIRSRVGGFTDDELRQLLVRAGALRFEGPHGEELWGLRDRNERRLT
jgi:hypothetical protein